MNKRKLLTGLLIFCLFFQMTCTTAAAAESGAAYTYTVTFYAGNQGAFTGTEGIYVYTDRFAVADGITKSMRDDGSAITVKGLKAGYRISFNDIPVNLAEDSRYYVRGLRQSGRDNATVAAPSFEVQQDADYVVVYGIRGNTVSYEVRYEDADGNTIAPSREYIGNVGDRPVVAFLYIEGYEPQAYNLVKALTENAAENVFTFVYNRIETGGNQPPAPAPDGTPAPEDGNQPLAPGAKYRMTRKCRLPEAEHRMTQEHRFRTAEQRLMQECRMTKAVHQLMREWISRTTIFLRTTDLIS